MDIIKGSNIAGGVGNLVFSGLHDELMMMVSNDGKFMGPIATGAIRKQESAVIQLPAVTGTIQGIYLFFGSGKRKLYSSDIYFGI